jgi:hypothetical protein
VTAIHLPNWDEPIDLARLDVLEHDRVVLYLAALLVSRLHLPEDLSLMDAIDYFPGHRGDDLGQLEAWVQRQLAQGPATFRTLQARLHHAIDQANIAWEPRRAELAAEAAREEACA